MTNNTDLDKLAAPKLLDQVRDRLRLKHYSIRTELTDLGWIKRYILLYDKRHPLSLGRGRCSTQSLGSGYLPAVLAGHDVAGAGDQVFALCQVAGFPLSRE